MADSDPSGPRAFRIGDWVFSPAANELHRGEARRKLEHRAARTLELLCRRRGSIVSQEEIVAEVWGGRSVSPNSVPVVISDLRQALGDDAREPRHIETVAKRGYRILAAAVADEPAAPADAIAAPLHARRYLTAAAIALLSILLIWLAAGGAGPRRTPVIVADVVNATGSPGHDPLATATSEVILAGAQKLDGIEAVRPGRDPAAPAGAFRLGARLIMWSGKPTVMMSAMDANGVVVWTGMTSGREELIPREVNAALATLPAKLGRHGR